MSDSIDNGAKSSPSTPTPQSLSNLRRRRPCDRCHAIKEKCRWTTDDADICERCSRLNFECRTDRPIVKPGRKPKLVVGNRLPLRGTKSSPPGRRESKDSAASSSDHLFASSPSEVAPSPGAMITTSRHQGELDLHQQLSLFSDLSSLELRLLEGVFYKQIEVDKYLIAPSFRDRHLQAFSDYLNAGMPILKDAFIACAPVLVGNQELQQLAHGQHIGHRRAAAAIASLRFLELHHDHDVPLVLILGMVMVTFALHHSGGEGLLCSYILGLVKSLYEQDSSFARRLGSDGLSFLICLLGTETTLCIVRSRIPTFRIRVEDADQLVDRYIGVSASMLSYFYDICELAHRIRSSCCRRGGVLMNDTIQEALNNMEQVIESWQPSVPPDFVTGRFPPTDVTLMLAQAKVLRLSALLVLHRLRYAFGTQDGKAVAMSNAILKELDVVVQVTSRSMPFGDLAYVVACFEITKPSQRRAVLTKSSHIVDFSTHVRQEMDHWIIAFWTARDNETGQPIFWENVGAFLGD